MHRSNLVWREGGALFFRPKKWCYFGYRVEGGQIKNWRGKNKKIGELEVGCIYFKDKFKPIFFFFLTWLL